MRNMDANTRDLFNIVSEERPKLLSFIRQRVHRSHESEDVYQEAMLRITQRVHSGDHPQDPVRYLYRIVINIINDGYRKAAENEETDILTPDIQCPNPQPEQHMESSHRMRSLISCLENMSAENRNIIIMRKLHGKSNIQISKDLGISYKAVEKKLNRAIRAMEEEMERPTHSRKQAHRKSPQGAN